MSYKLMVFRSSVMGGKRGQIVMECKVKRYRLGTSGIAELANTTVQRFELNTGH